jgi:hypothetical protein
MTEMLTLVVIVNICFVLVLNITDSYTAYHSGQRLGIAAHLRPNDLEYHQRGDHTSLGASYR